MAEEVTEHVEPDDARAYRGHAVDRETRAVNYFSVSALEKADTRPGVGGCLRRYFYRYAMGMAEAEAEKAKVAKEKGHKLHGRIKRFLRTGEMVLVDLEMRGLYFIPPPGADLAIEAPIDGHVFAGGVPLIGQVDCAHQRGVHYDEGGTFADPPGTVEVIDWKRKGSEFTRRGDSTILRSDQLIETIQMPGYGLWVAKMVPSASYVRLSHGYFVEKPKGARKVTRLHVIDDCARSWEYVDALARTVQHVVKETDPRKVPANRSACGAFGGCPHVAYCDQPKFNSLEDLVGRDGAMTIMQTITGAQPAFAPGLAAREAAAQPLPSAPPQAMSIGDAIKIIQASGLGFPMTTGAAAQEIAKAAGIQAPPGVAYAGSGQLGANPQGVDDPARLIQIAVEISQPKPAPAPAPAPMPIAPPAQQPMPFGTVGQGPAPAPQPVATHAFPPNVAAPLPPDAPLSQPHLAAAPVEPQAQAVAVNVGMAPGQVSVAPAPLPTAPQPSVAEQAAGADKKAAAAAKKAAAAAAKAAQTANVSAAASQVIAAPTSGGFRVYVDCAPLGVATTSLNMMLPAFCASIAQHYGVDDIRAASGDHALAFGRWKGVLAASFKKMCAAQPPQGDWTLETRGSEIAEVIAEALVGIPELYVRGPR